MIKEDLGREFDKKKHLLIYQVLKFKLVAIHD